MASPSKSIVILGAGGYAQEVAWIIDDLNAHGAEWNLLGFVDPMASGEKEHYGRPVFNGYEAIHQKAIHHGHDRIYFACGIGTPAIRRKECLYAEELGWLPAALVHPSVIRARFVSIGDGSTIGASTVLAPYARIGRHCAINVQATIGHDSCLGDFSVISPGARILGRVVVEKEAFIGANASVHPGRRVGSGATLGANSFLLSNLAPDQSAAGIPARSFTPANAAASSIPL